MKTRMILALAAAVTLSPSLAATSVSAQQTDATSQAAPAQNVDFSEDKLDTFVVAYVEVTSIGEEFRSRAEQTSDNQERLKLQQQAQVAMAKYVDGLEGITIDEYNAIFNRAATDQAFAEDLQRRVNATD
ncbi:DUF4168 domain-containing protein [Stappia sp. WLB 29]|uniref:DUF4168 domain-containing protein n=1 Tax=Stappia sp. WLB 29 TaxID=2925220 RepID=UPI0020BDE149|nr:DUF4168 domain-containing protein [Stappia sp. WLB 29]